MACCSPFACAADRQFDEAHARADLAKYRKKGPGPTTRGLLAALEALADRESTLLDVGAGLGILTHERLLHAKGSASIVEASGAYVPAARAEAERRGLSGRINFVQGDFIDVAAQLTAHDIVAMDRVVCCYPIAPPLILAAVALAGRWFVWSYPRDRWFVRTALALENAVRRFRRNPFRTHLHSPAEMRALIAGSGLRLRVTTHTSAWTMEAWER